MCVPRLVLIMISQVVFLLQRGQTHRQTDATERPTHAAVTLAAVCVGVGKQRNVQSYRHADTRRADVSFDCTCCHLITRDLVLSLFDLRVDMHKYQMCKNNIWSKPWVRSLLRAGVQPTLDSSAEAFMSVQCASPGRGGELVGVQK